MKKLINKLLYLTLLLIFLPHSAKSQDLWLKDIPVEKLESLYKDIKYAGYPKDHLMLDDRKYPRIFLKNFPLGYE